jgi:murein DD-endopeptidase MepM/ murein hydrolase activator NlpD
LLQTRYRAALGLSLLALLGGGSGAAFAQTGGTAPPPPPPEPDDGQIDGGSVVLTEGTARPGKGFFYGAKPLRFRYEINAKQPTDLRIEVIRLATGAIMATIPQNDVEPGVDRRVIWSGVKANGAIAPRGAYKFKVRAEDGTAAQRSNSFSGRPKLSYYKFIFPVRGPHSYGDGIGAGRGHRGQDLPAACGTKLVAARGGKVQYAGYQAGGAGYYLVIDGKRTKKDFVYMHLRAPALVKTGQRVKTGQKVGAVGSTGHSTGCHLHFEMWSGPGWYEGGRFLSPTRALKTWDRYS